MQKCLLFLLQFLKGGVHCPFPTISTSPTEDHLSLVKMPNSLYKMSRHLRITWVTDHFTLDSKNLFEYLVRLAECLRIRAGEFPKNFYAPGLKAGFWSKKCPQKAGEPYAQFPPSEIWAIVTTLIKIWVNTITQISEGENWA